MYMAVGNVSLDDWPRFTSSFGWIGAFEPMVPPAISMARLEITSLAFMFDWVPDPVWNTTSGKWSSSVPAITSSAARQISSTFSGGSCPSSPLAMRGALLEDAERADDGTGEAEPVDADREVLDRPLGLCAPVAVGRNLDRSHRVGLGAKLGHGPEDMPMLWPVSQQRRRPG